MAKEKDHMQSVITLGSCTSIDNIWDQIICLFSGLSSNIGVTVSGEKIERYDQL